MSLIFTQGLGGDQLVTQGWSSATPSASMITQGLGGPLLLLQGLVGAGSGTPFSPSGGLKIGGKASASQKARIAPSGGLALGSSGLVVSRGSHAAAAGGVAAGGAASPVRRASLLGSGGTSLGGSGKLPLSFTIVAGGGISLGGLIATNLLGYHVYTNAGLGGPINYAVPVATVNGQSWTSAVLGAPGHFKLGVRAYNPATGLEEQNIDAAVELVLDPAGRDITEVPPAPLGLRAFPTAAGTIRAEWSCPCGNHGRQPAGFHLYLGSGSIPDYSNPVSTVAWSGGRLGCFTADLSGLTDGQTYSLGVRGFNAVGEEANTAAVIVTADSTPPTLVESLDAIATNQEA
jgi:hypothetical protein